MHIFLFIIKYLNLVSLKVEIDSAAYPEPI